MLYKLYNNYDNVSRLLPSCFKTARLKLADDCSPKLLYKTCSSVERFLKTKSFNYQPFSYNNIFQHYLFLWINLKIKKYIFILLYDFSKKSGHLPAVIMATITRQFHDS